MEIKVNGKTLDVSLDKEKILADVISGLDQWLTNCGHRITGLDIDGCSVNAPMIHDALQREINSIKWIDLKTSSIAELTAASLLNLLEDIAEYESLDFERKKNYFEKWKESSTAGLLCSELKDLYTYCVNTFTAGSMDTKTLISITEEIQREVLDPVNEIIKIEQILKDICEKLIDLPLDIQTGKDARAAGTIQIFSAVTEKIFRIFWQLYIQGYLPEESKSSDGKPLEESIKEFSQVLKDLLDAYEKNDSVLVGDLTEYEASPKLKALYITILENIQRQADNKNNSTPPVASLTAKLNARD